MILLIVVLALLVTVAYVVGVHRPASTLASVIAAHQCPGQTICWNGTVPDLRVLGPSNQVIGGSDTQVLCPDKLTSTDWLTCNYIWYVAGGLKRNILTVIVLPNSVRLEDAIAIYGFPVAFDACGANPLMPPVLAGNNDFYHIGIYFSNNVSVTITSRYTYRETLLISQNDPVLAIHYSNQMLSNPQDARYRVWHGFVPIHIHCGG
jgi:hypothetical protein